MDANKPDDFYGGAADMVWRFCSAVGGACQTSVSEVCDGAECVECDNNIFDIPPPEAIDRVRPCTNTYKMNILQEMCEYKTTVVPLFFSPTPC